MKRACEAIVLLIGTLGWWGFVYPDLCLTKDAYEQEYEAYGECEEQEGDEGYDDCEEKQSEGGEITEAFRAFPDNKANAENDSHHKEVLTEVKKGKTMEISGTIRIKSRLIEYVYQGR